jgi:hypothetical protein
MTITASSHDLDEEVKAARGLHPSAEKYLPLIKARVDRWANASGANLYYCARDVLADQAPGLTNHQRLTAVYSVLPLLLVHVNAKGYKKFQNSTGAHVWSVRLV